MTTDSDNIIDGELAGPGTAVALTPDSAGAATIHAPTYSAEERALLKSTIANGTTDLEFDLFVAVARRHGLDPFTRQIYAIPRGQGDRRQLTIQTSIDGFRLLAQRSGKLRGIRGPWWCGNDGEWREVWLEDAAPQAAKVEVLHADYDGPVAGIARWGAFVQTNANGAPNSMWSRMGDHMLAKCAEALALRRAFPAELSGIYTEDEMGQASNEAPVAIAPPQEPRERPSASPQPAPRPPQARPQPPRAAVPPSNAPAAQQAQGAPERPAWWTAFGEACKARGIGYPEITSFLGVEKLNTVDIDAWLASEQGRTVEMLVEDAASLAKAEPLTDADAQPGRAEDGSIAPDDLGQ